MNPHNIQISKNKTNTMSLNPCKNMNYNIIYKMNNRCLKKKLFIFLNLKFYCV